jgi:hypothetical protein
MMVDATARGSVAALILPPNQLHALLIAETELGERICARSSGAASVS